MVCAGLSLWEAPRPSVQKHNYSSSCPTNIRHLWLPSILPELIGYSITIRKPFIFWSPLLPILIFTYLSGGSPSHAYSCTKRLSLKAPFIIEELYTALSSFHNKAPGTDGLPTEFYQIYAENLTPRLSEVFNAAFSRGNLPILMQKALVVVLL